jgi:hypothetical protein
VIHSQRTSAVVLLLIGFAGAAQGAEPISRPLGGTPAMSKAALKDVPRLPPPMMTVSTATLDAQGRVVVRCGEAENPAFRAWRERIARNGGQER